jgi:two-component system sensor histidine kinase RegB
MASATTLVSSVLDSPDARKARSDTPAAEATQGGAPSPLRMRMRTLIALRVACVVGELVMLAVVWKVLHWPFPPSTCLGLVAISAAMNLALSLSPAARREAKTWEIGAQLAFDLAQMTALIALTGGLANPFALLIIAPVTVSGRGLPTHQAVVFCLLAILAALVLAYAAQSPPWTAGTGMGDFQAYRTARMVAMMIAIVFTTGYATWSSAETARRELALNITETVLAREQRLSALGALAAAAAHELGTPLATIAIVATELAREAPEGPMRDDAELLVEQAKRCRDILKKLAETPERRDAVHERLSLLQFVREVIEPHAGGGEVRVEALVTGPPGVAAPDLWRRPEILHAISAFVENAFDFARSEILLTARFDVDYVAIEVRDDGPGFSPAIMARLGEPYVTSRPGAEGSRTGHVGMGLGFFIAKTLLERTGARLSFANGARGGAIVTARWPRAAVEATS